jgi:hypothetical protein
MQSLSRLPWALMVILILIWAAHQLIKRYITSCLDPCFTFMHLDPISCLVCMCARFQAAPKECYLRAVKRIMRYLVLTPNLGLWYPKGSYFELIGYWDANYAGCKVARKSTSETCQFLGWYLVSWSSKKQNFVAISTVKAEYVAATSCCAQLL